MKWSRDRRLERFDDPERSAHERGREHGQRVEADAGGQADGQGAQHHDRILRVVDLRSVANQVRGADDAEGAGQAGADDEHDDGADDREHDLRLDHGRRPRRRAGRLGLSASTAPSAAARGSRTSAIWISSSGSSVASVSAFPWICRCRSAGDCGGSARSPGWPTLRRPA